jgi:hypothetical protein
MRSSLLICGWISMCVAAAAGQAIPSAASRCGGLVSVKLDGATVSAATLVPAATALADVKLKAQRVHDLTAFCRVTITDRPSPDSDIRTEVWLPASGWNGRYEGHGNGGFAGDIYYDLLAASVTEGYATAGTDTGHSGMTGDFALGHPEKVKDFGWRAIHDMTVEAKVLIAAFYGKAPQHSYFAACSDGGREALMEAQRFPADYDGILAGAPAYNWTGLIAGGTADDQAIMATPASYLPAKKLPAIATAVRTACDVDDGVKDGILTDPRRCGFDPASMLCKGGDADDCLTQEQVKTLKTVYANKVDAQGKVVMGGYLPGAEDAQGGMGGWMFGNKPGDQTALLFFGTGFYSNFVYGLKDWSLKSFDFDRDYKLATARTGEALNATETNLTPFVSRGGRLILYHGWNDPAIPALSTIAYYDGVVKTMGAKAIGDAVRLYMVPGMLHCGGGPGATNFGQDGDEPRGDAQHDVFSALEQWVEAGKAPAALTAKGATMTRPLCAYPAEAKYMGGDVNDAKSFACVVRATTP